MQENAEGQFSSAFTRECDGEALKASWVKQEVPQSLRANIVMKEAEITGFAVFSLLLFSPGFCFGENAKVFMSNFNNSSWEQITQDNVHLLLYFCPVMQTMGPGEMFSLSLF